MLKDSEHYIVVKGVEVRGGGELHRFKNNAGELWSAIYVDGTEMFSCPSYKEAAMIKYWNSMHRSGR